MIMYPSHVPRPETSEHEHLCPSHLSSSHSGSHPVHAQTLVLARLPHSWVFGHVLTGL